MKSKKNDNFLQELYSVIERRAKGKDKKSYTRSLIKRGKNKIAEKMNEANPPNGQKGAAGFFTNL